MRLCRFFVLSGDVYCPDAIVDNTDSLHPPAIDLFGFEDQNLLHKFPDDLCVQLLNIRVLAYQRKEIICVDGFLPCIGQELFQFGVGCIENQKLNFYHVNIFSYNQIYNLGSEIAADLIRRFNLRTRQNKNGVKFSEVDKDAMVDYVAEAYYHIKPTVKKPKKPKPQKPVEGNRAKKPKTTPVATVKEAVKKQKNIYDFSNCLAYYANIINRPATTVKIENRYVAEVHVKELNRHEDGEYVKIKTGLLGIRFKKSGKNAKIVAPKEAEGEFSLIKREEFNWKVNY